MPRYDVFLGKTIGPWQNEEMRSALETRVRDDGFRVIPVLLPGGKEPGKGELFRRFPFSATISKTKIHLGGATMLEETFREWEQKVRREERREGEVEGMQKMAVEMLRQRFGRLPQAVRERVLEISSTAELKKLTRRIMTANSLQETGLV